MTEKSNRDYVTVIGVGYIGLPLTAALANSGFNVIGLDINKERVDKLNATSESDIYEPGVSETLKLCKEFIEFTIDAEYAIKKSKGIFITVGTPLKEDNSPDYSYIESTITLIGKYLQRGQVIILKSTVLLGSTEEYVRPKLEELSGLKAGEDFFLAFCPERTIEGLALHELYTLPKIIGGINKESTEKATSIIKRLGGKITIVSKPRVAEMCKLVDNMYRAMNIAFANEVGLLCEKMGIDAYEMVNAVNDSYSRTYIFKPGLGADGPCLSKDPLVFKYSADKFNVKTDMVDSCIRRNISSTNRIADMCLLFIEKNKLVNPKIAFVGLAFKGFPETDDIRGSPAVKIYNYLCRNKANLNFSFYDPIIKTFLSKSCEPSLEKCCENADIILFLTNHPRIMKIHLNQFNDSSLNKKLIVSCWNNLIEDESLINNKDNNNNNKIDYFRIGRG